MAKKKLGNVPFAIVWGTVFVVIAAALIVGNVLANTYASIISLTLGHETSRIEATSGAEQQDTQYFKSSYTDEQKLYEDGLALCEEITAEGIVLLKNDGNLLPLGPGKKLSFFSESSVDFVYGGSGSGSIDTSTAPTLKDAFEAEGFTVNPVLWKFYVDNHGSYTRDTRHVFSSGTSGSWAINECPYSEYTPAVRSSYAQYDDAAVVILSRMAGEGDDIPNKIGGFAKAEGNVHLLQLTEQEKSLFQGIQDDPAVKRIIVVVNSANALELGFLEDGSYSKIQAAVWVGGVGQSGLYALAKVFSGDVVPSGRLVDTYAYDLFSSPASRNMGHHTYTNQSTDHFNTYVVYQEGIYVGYKYYETRYEDVVTRRPGAGSYNYAATVQYPFGYGLSYTDFSYGNLRLEQSGTQYTVYVDVTNTGATYSGKETVQVYAQTPYTDYDRANRVEKAAVELVGFAKTDVLAPGQTETLVISVDRSDMRSYDYTGAKTFILDGGTYYLTAAKNAHDAVNNILAARGYGVGDGMDSAGNAALVASFDLAFDAKSYASGEDNYGITNQLQEADINNYGVDLVYLSRSAWEGTFPAELNLAATEQMIAAQHPLSSVSELEAAARQLGLYTDEMPRTGAANGISLITMRGAPYDDENWELLLDNLTFEEMQRVIRIGGYQTLPIESIVFNGQKELDGPAGISTTIVNAGTHCMAYPAECMLGASFNTSFATRLGDLIAEDGLHSGVAGWYAPSMNVHRTPFSGRNFEYYSEDGFEAGVLAAAEIQATNAKGLVTFVKHFAFNDQETNRMGIAVWANEQELREVCLEAFEKAVRNGGAVAIMSSMNRVGSTWSGAHVGLMTNILRNEWGFEGRVLSDYNGSTAYSCYQSLYGALVAGNDQMLSTNDSLYLIDDLKNSPTGIALMRRACKNILYSIVNGAGMNGISQGAKIVPVMPLWRIWVALIDVAVALLLALGIALVIRRCLKNRS